MTSDECEYAFRELEKRDILHELTTKKIINRLKQHKIFELLNKEEQLVK